MSGGVAGGRGGDADSRESRFAHLLEPIRDLASNWHIDLAGELEEFLHELDHIRITFEPSQSQALSQSQSQSQDDSHAYGGAKTLNFAQAALLIQGSACIYSRKVEFLYALLYQTLDALIDKRKSKQAASSISAAGDDLDAMLGAATEGALLDLDDTMVDARGIDLDDATNLDDPDANEEATHARQETMLIRAPLSLLSDNLYDASGDKESSAAAQQSLASQFKISACVMHPSGALLLEEKEATLMRHNDQLELDPGLVRTHGGGSPSGAASMPFGSPRGILLQNMQEAKQAEGIVTLSFDDQDDGGGFHDMGGDGGGFEDDDHENELEHKYDSGVADEDVGPLKKSVRFAEELEEANESISRPSLDDDDLWAQLDPHDDSALVPRPYRRGQTIRKPYVPDLGTTGADGGAISADLQIHLINSMQHANPTQAMIMRGIVKQNINVRARRARVRKASKTNASAPIHPYLSLCVSSLPHRRRTLPSSRLSTCASRRSVRSASGECGWENVENRPCLGLPCRTTTNWEQGMKTDSLIDPCPFFVSLWVYLLPEAHPDTRCLWPAHCAHLLRMW